MSNFAKKTNTPRDIVLYHTVQCSAVNDLEESFRGFRPTVLSPYSGFGKNRLKTGTVSKTPGFMRILNQFEEYRSEANRYGARIGLILDDPFGKEPVAINTVGSEYTHSSIKQFDECKADSNGLSIVEDFIARVSRVSYRRDIVLMVGSYPDSRFDTTEFSTLIRDHKMGVIYKDAFTHNDQTDFFRTLEDKVNMSNGRAWFGNIAALSSSHFINSNVKIYAPYSVWENASNYGVVNRDNAPVFSIQYIDTETVNESINDALRHSLKMSVAADLSQLSASQRLQLWNKLRQHKKRRFDNYR